MALVDMEEEVAQCSRRTSDFVYNTIMSDNVSNIPPPGNSDWLRYQEFVVNELRRHSVSLDALSKELRLIGTKVAATAHEGQELKELREAVTKSREHIAALEVRCGLFGAAAGTATFIVARLLEMFHK